MQKTFLSIVAMLAGIAGANAQNQRAAIIGGGSPDRGRCTVEVVVDGAVEVEIRGDNASLRNLSGQPPQFRRFECTSPMPPNPVNFRFSGVDGRGRQTLVRDPRNGGSTVVRIEDPQSGAGDYRFDLTWGGGGSYSDRGQYTTDRGQDPNRYPQPGAQYPGNNGDRRDSRDRYGDRNRYGESDRAIDRRLTPDRAIQVCQDAVRRQASERFNVRDMNFRRTFIDEDQGRLVRGNFEVQRGYNRVQTFRFSCSVDFNDGDVRSVDLQPTQDWRR
jgi:hypothetical protein